jgi:hypothetical protein
MSPSSFTFKLSVPNEPDQVAIVAAVARHAAEYATLDAGTVAGFVDRVAAAAGAALEAGAGAATQAVFTAADGALTLTMGGERVSQPLP